MSAPDLCVLRRRGRQSKDEWVREGVELRLASYAAVRGRVNELRRRQALLRPSFTFDALWLADPDEAMKPASAMARER